jgi:hypothetical protein
VNFSVGRLSAYLQLSSLTHIERYIEVNSESKNLSESLIFGIIAALLTIITIIQTYRANKFSKKAALAQGAFQKPNLQIDVHGSSGVDDLVIALPLGGQRVIEMPLVYTLLNSGEKSAKEIEVYVRMNKGLRYGGQFELVATGGEEKNAKMTVANETENLKTMVTTINSLHPNQQFVISDKISITSSTSSNHTISVKTADSFDMTLKFNMEIKFAIDIFISQADQSPITKRISLSIVDTSEKTVKDYFDEYNHRLLNKRRERIAKLGFFDRLKWARNDELKKVKLLIIDQSSYKENEILPAYIFNVDSMKMCEGLKTAQGYWIPALNVLWPDN